MTVWRVSNYVTLDGGGGLRASNRWHTRGRRIVYCAPNPATALLEVLVHNEIDLEDIPVTYQYLEIAAPDTVSVESLDLSALPTSWRESETTTRRMGDTWLDSGRTALLQVPCVIVPRTWNVLLNPLHPDSASVTIQAVHKQVLDFRLLR